MAGPPPATPGGAGPASRLAGLAAAWRGEAMLRRQLRNVGYLLTGNLAGSLIGLAAFALTARALGPAEYGVLALFYAYTRLIERLVTFQSWQPLIKYGAAAQGAGRRDDLAALFKFGLALDLAAALAAWAVAVLVALAARPWFGWDDRTTALLLLYCCVLPFNVTGMPTAVLRLTGRFRAVALGGVANAALRLALCALGVALGGGLAFFVPVWMGMQALGSLTTIALAARELRRLGLGLGGVLRAPLRGVAGRFPGLWGFAWSANLSLTVRSSTHELDTLIVGALADAPSAGLYHIAKRVGRMALQVGVQVQSVIYPDVARLWAEGAVERFRSIVTRVEMLLAGYGLAAFALMAFLAEPFLRLTAGPAFVGAAPLLVVQMLAVAATLSGTALRSALLAMGRQRRVLAVVCVATAAFHLTALALVPRVGAMGANVAHLVLGVLWLAGLSWSFRRALRGHAAGTAAPAALAETAA